MGSLAGGAFLVAVALELGASNTVIGLLAAIAPLAQLLQLPAVGLVDRIGRRRRIVVAFSSAARLIWLPVAALTLLSPEGDVLGWFLALIVAYYGLNAFGACAFGSWMRDLLPRARLGQFGARRQGYSMALGAVTGLSAAVWVDHVLGRGGPLGHAYAPLFGAACVAGLLGVLAVSRVPEPPAAPAAGSLVTALAAPFRDTRFRPLLVYLGWWKIAVNLATPFFTVYLLRRLELSMTWILGLGVLNQLTHVAFLSLWGSLSDRYSNKSVLLVAGPLFILGIVLWPFTTLPESYALTVPLLVAIHILAGVSTAGVTLCTSNIALKLAPQGQATAYLAVNAMVAGVAATLAPLIAGPMADWFAAHELTVALRWASFPDPVTVTEVPALSLRGLDFLFVISGVVGLFALHRLLAVEEEGEVNREVVLDELYLGVRRAVRHVSNVAGLRQLTLFPFSWLRSMLSDDPDRH